MRLAPGSVFMISSPPEEAEHIRGKTLTPESPKPIHYPSPSNIPILEKQMDPMLGEPALSIGTPASYQSYPQQTQTPSAHSTTSYYAEQQSSPTFQNAPAPGSVGATPVGYPQPAVHNGAMGAQMQDSPAIQNFSAQQQTASSFRDANSASAQDNRSAYPYVLEANAYAAQRSQAQSTQGDQSQPSLSVGTVDVQALLDKLTTPANNGVSSQYSAPSMPIQSHGSTPSSSLPAASSLPPRPPPQEKPSTHPNYNPNDDIRSYHPHSGHRGSTQLQPLNIRVDQPTMRSNMSPSTPGYGQRQSLDQGRDPTPDDEDQRWPPEVNKLYEDFLEEERRFVTEGQWDQFPMGSRLFIGNLPTEKVTKRDIFHRFYRHGRLAQISIKQAYGFVQFLDAESCYKALQAEQGSAVRGRKMHLEISKPQRNTKKADPDRNNGARRRSRSPDYSRGGTGPSPRNDQYSRSQNVMSPRDRDNRRFRDDDYRRIRSPSPRGGRGYRGRERSPYDRRRRSRSRSPRRYRSPSPRGHPSDDLPLPFRAPQDVPDVQVLVVDEGLPRDFIRWVEDTFKRAGLRIDVLIMSPRLDEAAVIRRQIVEGVLAIVRLNTAALAKGKINVQIFDRRGAANNVQFNEYADLDPTTAAALVSNAKQTNYQPVQPPAPAPSYGQSYGAPPPAHPYAPPTPTSATNPPNLSNLFSSLDPNGLSQLLGAMSGNTATQTPQAQPAGLTPDLARLLSSVSTPAPAPSYHVPAQPLQPYHNPYQNAALGSLLGGHPSQPAAPPVQTPTHAAAPGQPDMNEIMAQLAKYQR